MTQPAGTTSATAADLVLARMGDTRAGILFEGEALSWDDYARASIRLAHALDRRLDDNKPRHVGILMQNRPEYMTAWGGAALSGSVLVCLNATRRGQELVEDITATDCQVLLCDGDSAGTVADLDIPTVDIDHPDFRAELASHPEDAPPTCPAANDPATTLTMQFTSGSTGRPKAVIFSTGRFAGAASYGWEGISKDDVAYNAMPLFHSNALMSVWARMLYLGGGFALARKFSASGFLDDLLRYRVNFFNYSGRVLAYILAQPERPEEHQTSLKYVFGTEATSRDRKEFARRFGIEPIESYGSSEGGLNFVRTPQTPDDALGLPPETAVYQAAVIDPITGEELPRARFGPDGTFLNKDEAIGELVALNNASNFEGYYKADDANDERTRGGHFHSGDLGYRDEQGFFYFAGRMGDRFRVEGENFSAAPIERIIGRYPPALLAAVFPVPDEISGDQVMLALQLEGDEEFDTEDFSRFLADQPDLGTKWVPRYVRIVTTLPVTATRKINKLVLRHDGWMTDDPVFVRKSKTFDYRPVDDQVRREIHARFIEHGREGAIDA